uniref:F-box and WD repeat domain containing 12 n=1 Tax=Nothobranchius rachovii TaxID=451742 RepID=A0A1A8S7Q8_9TELE
MTKGRSGGYTCKSLRGHTGRVVGLVYLQGNSSQLPNLQSSNAIVCSASSDGTVRAWNVQNGGLLWCSPVQSPLTGILTDEECKVVITSDSTGLVKTWQGQTGQEVASYSTASPHCTLLQYNMNNGWFLTIGTSQGSDSFRVVTASQDLSLRVLTWRNHRDGGLTLESRYHLLGGSHTMARGFTHVACDYSSIVASVEGNDGKDVLKAYSFTS